MSEKSVLTVDIGSSKITAIVGERGVNNTFSLKGRAERSYEGFMDGRFFNEAELSVAVKESVIEAVKKSEKTFTEVFIGVPGAFVRVENKECRLCFGKAKKIKKKDIDNLFSKGQALVENKEYEIIGKGETYFALDDSRMVSSPLGVVSSTISAVISYVLCDKTFMAFFKKIFKEIKIKVVNFIYQGQAEGEYLLEYNLKEIPAILMDIGYITTDINVFMGNGIVAHDVRDFGGGILTFVLVKNFDLGLDEAEKIKRMINISATKNVGSYYDVETDNGILRLSRDKVNELIIECIDDFIGVISEFIESSLDKFTESPSIFLTGGGVSYLRGIKSHFSSRLGDNVEILFPQIPFFNKASESSKFSLLDYALKIKFGKNKR